MFRELDGNPGLADVFEDVPELLGQQSSEALAGLSVRNQPMAIICGSPPERCAHLLPRVGTSERGSGEYPLHRPGIDIISADPSFFHTHGEVMWSNKKARSVKTLR